ncbi:hypothetical protein ABE10_02805 [Bacillus toyonensis]|nr:hypothetical protein [Bacillus toyonensis]
MGGRTGVPVVLAVDHFRRPLTRLTGVDGDHRPGQDIIRQQEHHECGGGDLLPACLGRVAPVDAEVRPLFDVRRHILDRISPDIPLGRVAQEPRDGDPVGEVLLAEADHGGLLRVGDRGLDEAGVGENVDRTGADAARELLPVRHAVLGRRGRAEGDGPDLHRAGVDVGPGRVVRELPVLDDRACRFSEGLGNVGVGGESVVVGGVYGAAGELLDLDRRGAETLRQGVLVTCPCLLGDGVVFRGRRVGA